MMRETDPVTLLLVDGDIVPVNGRVLLASGLDAVVIGAETRMRLVLGEWCMNREVGVPWLESDLVTPVQAILGQRYDAVKLRVAMRKAILATPGVTEILTLRTAFDPVVRTASVTWRARCVFGDTDVINSEVS